MIKAEQIGLKIDGKNLLNNVSFQLSAGSLTALVGASGAGKTLLAKVLAGQITPTEGKLSIAAGSTIAMVEQQDNFFAQTGLQHTYYSQRYEYFEGREVPLVAHLLGIDIESWRDDVLLSDIVAMMHIEVLLDREILLLSNGERKRLQIALAWMQQADVYIFDQPFVGLDIYSQNMFRQLLIRLKSEGKTILLLCDPQEIPRFADRVLELEKGKLVGNLSLDDFVEKDSDVSSPPAFGALQLLNDTSLPTYGDVVRMKGVNVRSGEKLILQDIDWTVRDYQRWLLAGHNGSGKSTLLSLITADNPQGYNNDLVLFGQARGSGESIWEIKKKIGFVSPELHLYFLRQTKLTAFKSSIKHSIACMDVVLSGFEDEIGFSSQHNEYQRKQAEEWLKILRVEHLARQQFATISLGEQRILLLIRALIKNPPLLILDEPCQGLGRSQSERFVELLDYVCASLDSTMIYVTHRPDEIPSCITHVLELENGRVKSCL